MGNYYGSGNVLVTANKSEDNLIKCSDTLGLEFVRHANKSEDMNEHWDLLFKNQCFSINYNSEIKIDVKSQRKEKRGGKLLKDYFIIEWKNVSGNDGWIYGKADCITYEYDGYFYIFNREELLDISHRLINFDKRVGTFLESKNCIYQRKNRNDQMSLVSISGLLNLTTYCTIKISS